MSNVLESNISRTDPTEPTDISHNAEIVYLWDLLQWAANRARFIDAENKNPKLSVRINNYQKRVQSGIWNLTNETLSPVFNTIYGICQTVLTTSHHPIFPKQEIMEWIDSLSLFECQYLLDGINNVIYPESQTSTKTGMAYVHMIKAYLERRMKASKELLRKAS